MGMQQFLTTWIKTPLDKRFKERNLLGSFCIQTTTFKKSLNM